jgi:DnaJ-class molecular chaperone
MNRKPTVIETREDGRKFGWLGKDCPGCGGSGENPDTGRSCTGCGGTGEAYGEIKAEPPAMEKSP